jgi:hypothetical protein
MLNGNNWATNRELSGNVNQIAPVKTGTYHSPTDPSVVSALTTLTLHTLPFKNHFLAKPHRATICADRDFLALIWDLARAG